MINIIKISFYILFSLLPLAAVAQDSPVKSVNDVIRILNNVVKWTYTIFFITAVFFILIAAYKFLFAQDDPEKIKSAKNQIIYAVIAIIVALLAVSFDKIIVNFLGGGSGGGEIYGPPSSSNRESAGDYSDLDSKYTPPYGDDQYGDNPYYDSQYDN